MVVGFDPTEAKDDGLPYCEILDRGKLEFFLTWTVLEETTPVEGL